MQRWVIEPGEKPSANSAQLASTALAWLCQDFRPRMIVGDSFDVVWDNAAARTILAHGSGLVVRDGVLTFIDDGATRDFAAFLHGTGPQISTAAIPFDQASGHYLFRGWRVAAGDNALSYHESVSCLEICIDHKEFVPNYRDFDQVFRLTPAERGVVLELLDGSSPAQIASRHHISIVTVRSHLKKIYAKIGVISREQLFSRLRPFRVI